MISKKPLVPDRLRSIQGSFACIEHRFLRDGFFQALSHHELLLYLLLVLVSDRQGLSFYGYDKLCALLELDLDDYLEARNALIKKDLIAFNGTIFQVLCLPARPVRVPSPLLKSPEDMERKDPATVDHICRMAFGAASAPGKSRKGRI